MTMRREETVPSAATSERRTRELPVRIGISACLLGSEVRYDGGHKRDAFLADVLAPHVEWVSVCPEVEIGLGTPRPPIRREARGGETRLVMPETGDDLTDRMRAYAEARLEAPGARELSGYVLKSRSPSCGLGSVEVRGRGGERRIGDGAFAEVLTARRPLLPVVEETALAGPRRRENFVARVWAHHRWLRLGREGSPERKGSPAPDGALDRERLSAFHGRHRYLLLARDPAGARRLDRLLRAAPDAELIGAYARGFAESLRRVPTRESHEDVLRRISRRFSGRFPTAARDELAASIERYARGDETLIGPVGRIRALARRHGPPQLNRQVYLRPYPDELGLMETI